MSALKIVWDIEGKDFMVALLNIQKGTQRILDWRRERDTVIEARVPLHHGLRCSWRVGAVDWLE